MLLALALLSCVTDLPAGWEDAQPVDDLSQSACKGSPYDTGFTEAMTASAGSPGLRVVGEPLAFRCEQDVEAFYKVNGEAVDVLVQPVNMNPKVVAGCDCTYKVDMGIGVDPPAEVTLYRRWDAINDPNEPVEVGSASVTP